jgi:hypothetical protein
MKAGSTTWRDVAVKPETYSDLAALVQTARKARGRIVDFDWPIGADDLPSLRRAVYEWGCRYAGRYRCFDARMLKAINDALHEPNSALQLTEPRRAFLPEAAVVCDREGDRFRLRGHAPFDVVFAYGSAGVDEAVPEAAHLSDALRAMLRAAVESLGWDIVRLQRNEYLAVRNILYGNRPDYGFIAPAGRAAPPKDVSLHFEGPFAAFEGHDCRCLFTDPVGRTSGIYLWTINVAGEERVWYVGQTRRGFAQRTGEHLASYLSGEYATYDCDALAEGELKFARASNGKVWPETLPGFLADYENCARNVFALIKVVRFHCAQLSGDGHLHNKIEGMLARHYRRHENRALREFLMPGFPVPAALPHDIPVRLLLTSAASIAGLPTAIVE